MKNLLYFSAPWCVACRTTTPLIDKLTLEGLAIRKIDVMHEPDQAEKYEIKSLPNFLFLEDGVVKDQKVGSITEQEIRDWL